MDKNVHRGVDKNVYSLSSKMSIGMDKNVHHNTKTNNLNRTIGKKKPFNRELALEVNAESIVFEAKVAAVLAKEIPLTKGEQTTFENYRMHLFSRGAEWLKKGTQKLMALKRYADHNGLDETVIKKSFSAWMVRVAGYEKKEIA